MKKPVKLNVWIVSWAVLSLLAFSGCGDTVTNNTNTIADETLPLTPQDFTAVGKDGQVTLSWTPADGADHYRIYWATEEGVTESSTVINTNQFPFIHDGLSTSTRYYYRIQSINAAGESTLSEETSARARTLFNALLCELKASDGASSDFFGNSLAVSGDYAIVGAYANDDDGGDSGSAYIFHRTGLESWDKGTKILADDSAAFDNFGRSVSISGDYAIVGSLNNNGVGAAYIYHRTGVNAWSAGVKLTASDPATNDYFGVKVAIGGDYAVVSATGKSEGGFTDNGVVYVFHRTGENTWDGGVKLMAADPQNGVQFGMSVAIDNNTVVVGAAEMDGDALVNSGAVYIFTLEEGAWDSGIKITAQDAASEDFFGASVAIFGDYVIAGSTGNKNGAGVTEVFSGAAYIFHRNTEGSWDDGVKIVAPDISSQDHFGASVAISEDYVLVGAYSEDGGAGDPLQSAGAAYLFRRTGSNVWDYGTKIMAPDAQVSDLFGWSVAISGDTALIGASYEDDVAANAGKVYIF